MAFLQSRPASSGPTDQAQPAIRAEVKESAELADLESRDRVGVTLGLLDNTDRVAALEGGGDAAHLLGRDPLREETRASHAIDDGDVDLATKGGVVADTRPEAATQLDRARNRIEIAHSVIDDHDLSHRSLLVGSDKFSLRFA